MTFQHWNLFRKMLFFKSTHIFMKRRHEKYLTSCNMSMHIRNWRHWFANPNPLRPISLAEIREGFWLYVSWLVFSWCTSLACFSRAGLIEMMSLIRYGLRALTLQISLFSNLFFQQQLKATASLISQPHYESEINHSRRTQFSFELCRAIRITSRWLSELWRDIRIRERLRYV